MAFLFLLVACSNDNGLVEDEPELHVLDLSEQGIVDTTNRLVLYNGQEQSLPEGIKIDDRIFQIETPGANFQKGTSYTLTFNTTNFQLFKTDLPIILIEKGNLEIVDEPKIPARMMVVEQGEVTFNNQIGVELRGGFSQTFPKKSYSVELWEDSSGDDTINHELLGMRNDDDWILDGLWNEPLRLRDFVCHEIWGRIARYPYSDIENISIGIKRKFCELFVNGKYFGVYYLGEKIDRKQLALQKYKSQLTGELYKGIHYLAQGVDFLGLEDYSNTATIWSGYEAKYPKDIGELDWTNLHELVDFVHNSDQITFDEGIYQRIDLENAADYFIFLNLIFATDNTGKNLYTARYDQNSTYFFTAWDMDGSFGNDWTGGRTDITNEILTNGLFAKLLLNPVFKDELRSRWNTLRSNELATQTILGLFDNNYGYLESNGIYVREAIDQELPQNYSSGEIGFIHSWTERRVAFLDNYFDGL